MKHTFLYRYHWLAQPRNGTKL